MFKLVIVGSVIALSSMVSGRSHLINKRTVSEIKERTQHWEAHTPETNPLGHMTNEELLNLIGAHINLDSKTFEKMDSTTNEDLPENFDPRTEKFSKCIHPIRDQAQCGSCWAFGAVETLADRFCIAGKDVILSPQDLVSCDTNNYGCSGGYIELSWEYLSYTGAVSEACYPYTSGATKESGICVSECLGTAETWEKYTC